jgi:hypothetical protein
VSNIIKHKIRHVQQSKENTSEVPLTSLLNLSISRYLTYYRDSEQVTPYHIIHSIPLYRTEK